MAEDGETTHTWLEIGDTVNQDLRLVVAPETLSSTPDGGIGSARVNAFSVDMRLVQSILRNDRCSTLFLVVEGHTTMFIRSLEGS